MRITNGMMTSTMLRNLQGNLNRLETLHTSITTGKRISRPSDDPSAIARALTYSSDIAAGEQYIRTMDAGLSWMDATEGALGSATDLLQKARELAVQGSNDTLTADELTTIGAQIEQVLKQMVTVGNSSIRNERLFAGFKTDTDPFVATGTPTPMPTYAGDAGVLLREFAPGDTIDINTPGPTTFSGAFSALINLRDNLNTGDTEGVTSESLVQIDAAFATLMSARAQNGAKTVRLEQAKDRQDLFLVNLKDLLSKTQDTDMVDAISKFTVQETLYKASLEASAKAIQPSLMDYLR